MIIKQPNGTYLIWNKKLGKTGTFRHRPMIFRLIFNYYTNELEFKSIEVFNHQSYSIEELESMLKELKRINKEEIK